MSLLIELQNGKIRSKLGDQLKVNDTRYFGKGCQSGLQTTKFKAINKANIRPI